MAVSALFPIGTVLMSADMPGQKTEDSSRAVIIDTAWWAACRLSTSPRSEGGTITLSLNDITSVTVAQLCCEYSTSTPGGE